MSDSILHKEEEALMPGTLTKNDMSLPSKRKLDLVPISEINEKEVEEETEQPNKTQKLQSLNDNGNEDISTENKPPSNNTIANSSIPEDKTVSDVVSEEEEDDVDYEDDDDEDDNDNDDEEEEEEEEENQAVDRKGKGIMIEEEEEDDDSDDGSEMDGGDDEEDEVDLEDDPLAEVDLDNILPSRTRRQKSVQPGVFIGKGLATIDEDDSDP